MNKRLFLTTTYVFTLLSCVVHAKKVFPLKNIDGSQITTIQDWESKKIKIKHMLQEQVYGYRPVSPQKDFELVKSIEIAEDQLEYSEYLIGFRDRRISKKIRVSVFSPLGKKTKGVFLTLNRCGNHTLYEKDVITIDPIEVHPDCYKKNQLARGARDYKISAQKVTSRGYAIATIAEGYIDADDPTKKDDGIAAQFIPNEYRSPISWGHLMSWSWGLSQTIDLIKSENFQHSSDTPLILIGHSRRGKAALLTGAFDERVDITIAHQSGMGGTARIRGAIFPFRESAHGMFNEKSIIYKFVGDPHGLAHFFASSFEELSKHPNKLDFDAQFLTSLVAPRFLLDVQGTKDRWAGPKSAWTTIRKTFPVYQLYGKKTPKQTLNLGEGTQLDEVYPIMQIKRKTKHEIEEKYWDLFLNYSDLAIQKIQSV